MLRQEDLFAPSLVHDPFAQHPNGLLQRQGKARSAFAAQPFLSELTTIQRMDDKDKDKNEDKTDPTSENLDKIQSSLELLGMIPGLGIVADGANVGISLLRGNYADALINLAAMVPLAGQGVTGGKLAAKAASSAADVLKATKAKTAEKLVDSADMGTVRSGLKDAVGKTSTKQVGSVVPDKTISASSPSKIAWGFGDLSKRQQGILDQLPDTLSSMTLHKKSVGVADLAAMTARTGDEFALFTNGSQRLVVRGNPNGVPMTRSELQSLSNQGYKWSGHSHPGTSDLVLDASGIPGDRLVLDIFKQEQSLILNSAGKRNLFNMSDNIRIE